MQYLGDYAEDYATLNFKFSTHKADGTPATLSGTPAISVYKANGTTQSTAGITLSVDFDSVTGLNNVLIDLSADAFYAVANDYAVVITTGTVDSVSVVGAVVANFSIENRNNKVNVVQISGDTDAANNAELMFDGTGYAGGTTKLGVDVVAISGDTTSADNLESYTDGTTPAPVNVTQISGDSTAADNLEAATDGGTYNVGGGAVVSASVTAEVSANVTKLSGDATAADNAESFFDGTGYAGTNNVIPTVTAVSNGVALADDAITSAKFDETTAFPLKSDDSGATAVARTGADSDTLETLSDQIDTAQDDLDILTGVDGATLATLQANYAPAVAGDAMTLANDAVSAAALASDALAEIKAEVEAVMATTARAELAAVPAANASLADKLTWITMILRNKRAQTNTTETVYADDGATSVATSTKTDDGTTYTRGEYA